MRELTGPLTLAEPLNGMQLRLLAVVMRVDAHKNRVDYQGQ